MQILETQRLILRGFQLEDAQAMYDNWATDNQTQQYVSWAKHSSVNESRQLIQKFIDCESEYSLVWAVEIKDAHELIGSISAADPHHADIFEIGYTYGSKYWGNGYATEALKAVIDYLHNEKHVYMITARHFKTNPASGRVMEKSGLHQVAVLPGQAYNAKLGLRTDLICFSDHPAENSAAVTYCDAWMNRFASYMQAHPAGYVGMAMIYLFFGLCMLFCAYDTSDTCLHVIMYIGAIGSGVFTAMTLATFSKVIKYKNKR